MTRRRRSRAPRRRLRAPSRPRATRRRRAAAPKVVAVRARELASLRAELARRAARPPRWNADPEDVQRAVARLVLSLVEFLRKLFERQAVRRMQAGTLAPDEVEAIGLALMRLESVVRQLARRFRLRPDDLNLDLGPLGRLS